MNADPAEVVKRILGAHGGVEYWQSVSAVEVSMSARGFLFRAKHIRPLNHAVVVVDAHDPRAVMKDFPKPGCTASLLGTRRVEIRDASGTVLRHRDNPRRAFGPGRRTLYWDDLDFVYFSGYAMWCYLTLPFLLLGPGVNIERCRQDSDGSAILTVRFPDFLPVHSPVQTLYFDPSGRLVRHDYTAEVVGGWAKAAQLCSDYRKFGGLWAPTRRRVYPRGPSGRPLPGPLLVGIDIHDLRPIVPG
ncbi:MAG: hypothetical protein U0R66_13995 [Mycobacterium sp.]